MDIQKICIHLEFDTVRRSLRLFVILIIYMCGSVVELFMTHVCSVQEIVTTTQILAT